MVKTLLKNNIPEGWHKYSLGDVLLSLRNGTSSTQVSYKTIYPVTRIETISNGSVDYEKVGYVENLDKSYKIEKGDLLLSNINSLKHIGKVVYFDSDKNLYHGMNLLLLRFNELLDKKFGYYLLKSKKRWFEEHASKAVNQASINQTTLNKLPLIVPKNIKEQKKIAEILAKIDEEIILTNNTISKKIELKSGLITDFLNKGIGHIKYKKSDLDNIPESWHVKRISEFSKLVSDKNANNQIELVVSVTKYNGIVSSLDYFNKQVYSKNISTYKIIKRNQFAYATIHLDEGSIGYLDFADVAVLSPMYTVFEVDENLIDIKFFYNLLKSHRLMNIYKHLGKGSVDRRKSISFNDFSSIRISLPPIEEQKKISSIITLIDDDINKYKDLFEKLILLRDGLTSDLVSGKVRTKPNK